MMTPEELEKRARAAESEGLQVTRVNVLGFRGPQALVRISVHPPARNLVDQCIETEILGEP